MAQEYDLALKSLVDRFPEAFAKLVLGEAVVKLELLDKELPASKKSVDYLCKITIERERFILHIEFQSSYDARMPERMFQYAGRITEKYPGLPIYSVVLYLNEADRHKLFPGFFELKVRNRRKTYHEFDVIKIWNIDAKTILGQELKGLLPLVPLMQYEESESEQIAVRCIQEIQVINDPKLQADALAGLYVLSGLKKSNLVWRRIMDENMSKWLEQSVTYQEILSKGLKKGEKQGLERGLQKGLQQGLQQGLQKGVTDGLIRSILAVLRARFGEFKEKKLAQRLHNFDESRLSELVALAVITKNLSTFEKLVNGHAKKR